MGIGEILTELATGLTSCLEIILPGAAESVVQFGDKLIWAGEGDAKKVSAVFGMMMLGGVLGFCFWGIKKIVNKVT